jgi:hypothetical protein
VSTLHSALADRTTGWIVLALGTASGLTELGAAFAGAGLPKWGHAILLGSLTASVILQSFKASLNPKVNVASIAEDLGTTVPSVLAVLPKVRVPLPPSEEGTQS